MTEHNHPDPRSIVTGCQACFPTRIDSFPPTAVAARSGHEALTVEIADRFADAVRDGVLQELFGNLAAEIIQIRGTPVADSIAWQDFTRRLDDLNTSAQALSGHNGSALADQEHAWTK